MPYAQECSTSFPSAPYGAPGSLPAPSPPTPGSFAQPGYAPSSPPPPSFSDWQQQQLLWHRQAAQAQEHHAALLHLAECQRQLQASNTELLATRQVLHANQSELAVLRSELAALHAATPTSRTRVRSAAFARPRLGACSHAASCDDDDEDDEDEDDADDKPSVRRDEFVRLKRLSSATVASLKTDLSPDTRPAWIKMLTVRLGAHDSRLAHLLGPAAAASLAPGALTPEYAHVNQWLAVTILDALDKTALIVTNLVAKMPATKLTDGHHLFRAICDLDALSPSQIAHAENAFKDLKLLTMGMSDVACEAACRTLLRRHEILPCNKGCDDTTKMAMLLDKMPDELRKDSADLKTQLYTGVVTGKAPWSIDTLIQVIAIHLAKGAARLTAHSGMSDDPTAHLGDDKKKECLNCGKSGHTSRDCRSKCPTCKLAFCPGNYGGAPKCILASPNKPLEVKNAKGRVISSAGLINKLLAKHKEKYPQAHAADVPEPAAASATVDISGAYSGSLSPLTSVACLSPLPPPPRADSGEKPSDSEEVPNKSPSPSPMRPFQRQPLQA